MAGLYLHVPFCATRCIYCGFYSTLTPKTKSNPTIPSLTDQYVETICQEMLHQKEWLWKGDALTPLNEKITTIYLGGGTPSQLSIKQLGKIFQATFEIFKSHIEKPQHMEITMECNPDDLTEAYVAGLAHLPINRISMGAQTFSDEQLQFLRRRHCAKDVIEATERLRKAGFNNISIDLMFGFPNQTLTQWQSDIDTLLALSPEHISAYSLMYEEGTPLYRLLQEERVKEIDAESYRLMYDTLIDSLLQAGYEQYEISNFAKQSNPNEPSSFRSQHNSSYWNNTSYLGLGASAHSYNGKYRQWNISDIRQYLSSNSTKKWIFETEEIDEVTHYNDLIVTALRTKQGINTDLLQPKFRTYILRAAQPYIENKLLVLNNSFLHFTREGIYISDSIMSELMYVENE